MKKSSTNILIYFILTFILLLNTNYDINPYCDLSNNIETFNIDIK